MSAPEPRDSLTDPSLLAPDAAAAALATDPERGLSAAESARRLLRDGRNELRTVPPDPLWRRILAHFRDPLIYLLLAAVVITLVAWRLEGMRGLPVDAIVILAIVVLNAALGFVQQARSENAAAALAKMTAVTSSVPCATAVPLNTMLLRSPSAAGAASVAVSFSTATLSPVSEASSTRSAFACSRRASAPMLSPSPSTSRSPRTSSALGTRSNFPSRRAPGSPS